MVLMPLHRRVFLEAERFALVHGHVDDHQAGTLADSPGDALVVIDAGNVIVVVRLDRAADVLSDPIREFLLQPGDEPVDALARIVGIADETGASKGHQSLRNRRRWDVAARPACRRPTSYRTAGSPVKVNFGRTGPLSCCRLSSRAGGRGRRSRWPPRPRRARA